MFEAAARALGSGELERPQQPAALVEILATDGYVTPEEADVLRRLGHLRNEAAHGGLDIVLSREDLDRLVEITRTLLGLRDRDAGVLSWGTGTPSAPG